MVSRLAVVSMLVFTAACNSPGYVNEFQQPVFKVRDAVFVPIRLEGEILGGKLLIADEPSLCESLSHGFMPKRLEAVQFNVFRMNDRQLLAPEVGSYEITADPMKPGSLAFGAHLLTDLNCTQTLEPTDAVFRDGTLEIERLETGPRGMVSGKFRTYVSRGDFFRAGPEGQFLAQWCDTSFEAFTCR